MNTLPYLVQVSGDALKFGAHNKVVDQNYIFTSMTENLSFRSVQSTPGQQITDYGPLHVNSGRGSGSGSMHTDLVRGQPYMTMHYTALPPDRDGACDQQCQWWLGQRRQHGHPVPGSP